MTYAPPLVLLYPGVPTTTTILRDGLSGFPSTFDHLLVSMWVCLGPDTNSRIIQVSNTVPMGTISIDSHKITIQLRPGQSLPLMINATYAIPVSLYRYNLLVSIDAPNQIAQVYLNDVPLSITSGGWIASGSFNLAGFSGWRVTGAGSAGPGAAVGDLYAAAPTDFFDLSLRHNRRQFINADLTPVDLTPNAIGPLGVQPPIFLSAQTGVANDIATNYGSGGVFTILGSSLIFQTSGSCQIPPPPPPSPWTITSDFSNANEGGVGDFWFNNSYVNFSDPTILAKFINPDGSWVNLGENGELPTGISPIDWLTIPPGDDANDFLTGYGQNGSQSAWNLHTVGNDPHTGSPYLTDLEFDDCPPSSFQSLDDLTVEVDRPIEFLNYLTLRWSDDAGFTWSNGLLKSLGNRGEYAVSPTFYRLGMSRNRIFEVSWAGDQAEALTGVWVNVTTANS